MIALPQLIRITLLAFLFVGLEAEGAKPPVSIELGTSLSWATTIGNSYQLQGSATAVSPWEDVGEMVVGDGAVHFYYHPVSMGLRHFQVVESVPGTDPSAALPINGGFEDGTGAEADHWTTGASQAPTRSGDDAHSGLFSLRCALLNVGAAPSEGLLRQRVVAEGGTVVGGESYDFSFWVKQVSIGSSLRQEFDVQWRDESDAVVGGTGVQVFSGEIGNWEKVSVPGLVAPASAVEARISFRFVTGAVDGGHGEALIDDITLGDPLGVGGMEGETNILSVTSEEVVRMSWPSVANTSYQPLSATDLVRWTDIEPEVVGDGGIKTILVPRTELREFYRLEYPDDREPPLLGDLVALFDANTILEPATTIDTPTALITHVGDRARDRHAREDQFHSYDHYLSWYWEERTMAIEIIDEVAKGGSEITVNYTTQAPLGAKEFRAFFAGVTTEAQYHLNAMATVIGPNQYSATISGRPPGQGGALQIGDRIELEISQFLEAATNGRNNYYGTAILYIVGQGIVPWEGVGEVQDSFPLPETAWLGGQTTLPYQYSNEPEHRFKQTAGNIAPINIQPFMLGRRLHHTDFDDGGHSESGNPIFDAQVGKLGPKFIANSCVACHTNNGRALPPAIGAPMFQTVVKVGADVLGSPHPNLGSVLQPQATSGAAVEGSVTIASYTTTVGQYADGTPFSLRKPNYEFSGVTPTHFSARLAPPLVGLGLLEAVSERTILTLADPDDLDADGISGKIQTVIDPESGEKRLGRFTSKGGQARLSHQIAGALNTDMGVTTSVFPMLDGETTAAPAEISDADLDLMTRYIALLGVGARRDLTDSQALAGEQLFATAGCIKCHSPELTTSGYHPYTELRSQTIHPYTDLLLHDMGSGLADNMGELDASGSEWRTPPLWGIGLTAGVSGGEAYLHDGRARSLEEAILWHGGEGEASKENFRTMSAAERTALIKFLKSL